MAWQTYDPKKAPPPPASQTTTGTAAPGGPADLMPLVEQTVDVGLILCVLIGFICGFKGKWGGVAMCVAVFLGLVVVAESLS